MNYTNLIRDFVEWVGMLPDGVMIGLMGSICRVLFPVNSLNFKQGIAFIFLGAVLCGYGMPVLLKYIVEEWAIFACLFLGFSATDVFQYAIKFIPVVLTVGGEKVKKILSKNESNNN